MIPAINADRLWQSIMDMARIGPTPDGGSCRLALSPEDTQARELLLDWCGLLNLRFEQDAIGNMFLRRNGSDDTASAVAFGSHLDTVPTGGRFDGVFGVLAGLEVIRALDEAGIDTRAPLELVNWTNEEGSRFRPAMMGSRVHAANMVLEEALAVTDDNGVSVRDALRDKAQARQFATRDMMAAAGHDSVLIAPVCPSAMLFIPSVGGITHNPREYSTKEQVAQGAQVLLDAVLELAA